MVAKEIKNMCQGSCKPRRWAEKEAAVEEVSKDRSQRRDLGEVAS